MAFDTIEIKLCDDCVQLIANDDLSSHDDDGDAHRERFAAHMGDDARDVSVACVGDCDHGFSIGYTCGGCGTDEGGEYHDGVILRPVTAAVRFQRASDWLYSVGASRYLADAFGQWLADLPADRFVSYSAAKGAFDHDPSARAYVRAHGARDIHAPRYSYGDALPDPDAVTGCGHVH